MSTIRIRKKRAWLLDLKQRITNIGKKLTPDGFREFFRKLNWKRMYMQKALFKGGKEEVYCPIARQSFKIFPKDYTISNGARSRHRLFWLYLERETTILKDKLRVLHCAPQNGILDRLKKQSNLEYVPFDRFMAGYNYHNGVRNMDLLNIKYDDNYFDYIICNRVLEHVPEDIKGMNEMYRVLKPGGTALLSVPMDWKLDKTHEVFTSRIDRIKYYGQWDHVRMYAPDIQQRLENVGFKVEMNRYSDNFSKEEFKKFGLCVDTIIVCRK